MMPRPRHIVRLSFERSESPVARFACHLPPGDGGWRRLLILIHTTTYPLERHCCYMRHPAESEPYTFSRMEFNSSAPGIRVGPWPGWRRIPALPGITIAWDGGDAKAEVHFWGDEFECKHIRAMVWIPPECKGVVQCAVEDDRLEPAFLDLFEDDPVSAQPRPVHLRPELLGVHPRLLITPDRIAELTANASTTHKTGWTALCALVDGPRLPPEVTPESKTLPGPERLRPEDRAMISALIAIVDPSPRRVEQALEAYRAFVREARRPDYAPLTIDTQSGEILFVLVLCFDWLHNRFSETEREELREWLWGLASRVRSFLPAGRRDFAQAHYLGCALGLLAFSFVFWESHPDSRKWAGEFRGALDTILGLLPDDGFHPHGANLWIYEYGFLLRWVELFRVCAGEDLWSAPHWRQASAFRAATLSSDGRFGITFGDPQYRVGGDSWCHYLIAARTLSPEAQRTGDLLIDGPHAGVDFRHVPPRRRVYEFLFREPRINAESGVPDEKQVPGVRVFADGGQVFARGTGQAGSLVTFRAGPPLGTRRYSSGERGAYGHADPCNGSFLWFRHNSLCVSAPGPTYRRDSANHNVITFGGKGQVGDGTVWLPDFFPPEFLCPTPTVSVHDRSVSLDVDAACSYLPFLRVKECRRALWMDPDAAIVGVDTIECEDPTDIEWNLHSRGEFVPSDSGDIAAWRVHCADESLSLHLISPVTGKTSTGWTPFVPAYPHDGTRDHFFRWTVHGTRARFVWSLVAGSASARGEVSGDENTFTIRMPGGLQLRFDGGRLLPEGGRC
ncbi:MAG TPA: hypothetical protein VLT13_11050 [Bacteroidota bacterium]|nr:hypothetical protein [Bacteroidota bacterium]